MAHPSEGNTGTAPLVGHSVLFDVPLLERVLVVLVLVRGGNLRALANPLLRTLGSLLLLYVAAGRPRPLFLCTLLRIRLILVVLIPVRLLLGATTALAVCNATAA